MLVIVKPSPESACVLSSPLHENFIQGWFGISLSLIRSIGFFFNSFLSRSAASVLMEEGREKSAITTLVKVLRTPAVSKGGLPTSMV